MIKRVYIPDYEQPVIDIMSEDSEGPENGPDEEGKEEIVLRESTQDSARESI